MKSMATTAWEVLQEQLKLPACEEKVLLAMLGGDPRAFAGEEAVMPVVDLIDKISTATGSASGTHPDWDSVKQALDRLASTYAITDDLPRRGVRKGFPLIDTISCAVNSALIQYRWSGAFLRLLRSIAQEHELEQLF
ncbi:hypothetical protein PQR75_40840 [Paraburkholderia fungorum]|uniref:hypothetical protein n=1 Tax=Paraburkholderia fungorum TaxID=134537 RepID=UPI0038BDCAE9